MQRIAVLFTCFNRREKTLNALKCLYQAHNQVVNSVKISIFLTDDGSTDGTGDAIKEKFPEVKVLQGNGNLYWAGGMRKSWGEAIKGAYDAYLLLNDDTDVYETLFKELLLTHDYSLDTYGRAGIYIGSTIDKKTNKISYGGSVFTNKFRAHYTKVIPNGRPQKCELGNANIMLVCKKVVEQIGILSDKFIHGLADLDYTLKAVKNDIPVLITPHFLGECYNDHKNPYDTIDTLSIRERVKLLYNPVGLDFKSNIQYMKRNFPYRLPFVYLAGYLKVLFPKFYVKKLYKNR